jgi:ArsR family metal-binding transcriptional regulator
MKNEDWLDRVKNNASDAWENVKDKANEAWEKTKDAAEDVKAEWNKKTN